MRGAIASLLRTYPTPSALLCAPEGALVDALRPLGLQAVRLAALRAMSRDFLARASMRQRQQQQRSGGSSSAAAQRQQQQQLQRKRA